LHIVNLNIFFLKFLFTVLEFNPETITRSGADAREKGKIQFFILFSSGVVGWIDRNF
jgi:hypothetical protein